MVHLIRLRLGKAAVAQLAIIANLRAYWSLNLSWLITCLLVGSIWVQPGLAGRAVAASFTANPTTKQELTTKQPLLGFRLAAAEGYLSGHPDDSSTGLGFILGVAAPQYRVYADLNFYSWDAVETRTIHANYDYVWNPTAKWQVFTGLYAGLVDLELASTSDYKSGPSAGVQTGLTRRLGASSWQVETGLRWGGFSASITDPTTQQKVSIQSQIELFVHLNLIH